MAGCVESFRSQIYKKEWRFMKVIQLFVFIRSDCTKSIERVELPDSVDTHLNYFHYRMTKDLAEEINELARYVRQILDICLL